MEKAKVFWTILDKIFLGIGGMTIIEFIGAGVWDLSFLSGIDESLKTATALAAFIYLAVSLPYKIAIMKIDRKRKKIDNEIREFEKKKLVEELRKMELENNKAERDGRERETHTKRD